ncbi:MAG: MarR family transcriptional regulator [Oceanospirillaceae bacterium]|nr:MarR family transcriptional regulator [Oceanospirillaceae bacterium]
MDKVDKIIQQWNTQRPDLDVSSMALIGRVKRVGAHLTNEMAKTFAQHQLNSASFDMLATLRRSGEPYALSPNELIQTMMVTSGTMTNRIDQLVKRGLVERIANPNDGRSFIIALTAAGFKLIDEAVTAHVATQKKLTSSLSDSERQRLNTLLTKFLAELE